MRVALVALLVSVVVSVAPVQKPVDDGPLYSFRESFTLQCLDQHGAWGRGPMCHDAKQPKELSFIYGLDEFVSCPIHVRDQPAYEQLSKYINRTDSWRCRVPMTPGKRWFLPLTIDLFGGVETAHVHVTNHVTFVFHAEGGKIIGAGAYAVQDRLSTVVAGSLVPVHHPVRWFKGHSFEPLLGTSPTSDSSSTVLVTVGTAAVTAAITLICAALVFRYHLRPALMRSFIKQHSN